jgi:flagellar basal-body rod modification protein FlgD
MTVSATNSTAGQSFQNSATQVASAASNVMNADTFMKLFTAQIANQNPMEPMNSADFLNQFAQITSVQTMSELQKTLGAVGTNMQSLLSAGRLTQAQSLLGHKVGYTDATGSLQQGVVEKISIAPAGDVQLTVSGTQVGMDSVNQVQ